MLVHCENDGALSNTLKLAEMGAKGILVEPLNERMNKVQ